MAGNIVSRTEYAYTTGELGDPIDTVIYSYGDSSWGDLLTAYDGTAITYDTVGNPLNDGTWTYTWRSGRELASMSNGTVTWRYAYDANGMRTGRWDSNIYYDYVYNGSLLRQMIIDGWQTIGFTYDASGIPLTITYYDETYYYITNLQGDVVGIADSTGALVVRYAYDAWGKLLSITGSMADTLGVQNPLRYRGYVYDQETGLYYLQSRYYDPEIGRFLNADALVATGQGMLGNNMFAYCRNNPVIRKDVSGTDDIRVTYDEDDNPLNDVYYGSGGAAGGGNSGGYAYSPPPGGGGVSTRVQVGDITVTFGHGGRHPAFTDISGLEKAIANDVVTQPPTTSRSCEVNIAYGGTWFTYRYWTIDSWRINVGTYFYRVSK